jgi:hypothetical protein
MREYRDASGRLSFDLAHSDDEFDTFAQRMIQLNGKPVKKLCDAMGDDQYWDFKAGSTIVVLHSNRMAGVSIHVEDGTHEDLLRDIVKKLTEDE